MEAEKYKYAKLFCQLYNHFFAHLIQAPKIYEIFNNTYILEYEYSMTTCSKSIVVPSVVVRRPAEPRRERLRPPSHPQQLFDRKFTQISFPTIVN